jgi:uncharacterized membrane protein YeaQ/YmgE (transglycosylase-associated protein family)
LGEKEVYGYQQGPVKHRMLGASGDFVAAWKWLYLGIGAQYLRDLRTFLATTDQFGNPFELSGQYPEYDLTVIREFIGVTFGNDLRFNFEMMLMDDAAYHIYTEPGDPIFTAPLTLSFAMVWSPSRMTKPESKERERRNFSEASTGSSIPRIAPPPRPLFDNDRYWRSVKYGSIASAIGLVTGVVAGSLMGSDGSEFFPLPVIYGWAGSVLGVPVGTLTAAYTDPEFKNTPKSHFMTLAGTAVGFGGSLLHFPVTAGLSFYFVVPLGSAIGFQYGRDE